MDATVSKQVFKWFERFKRGKISVEDQVSSGFLPTSQNDKKSKNWQNPNNDC